MAFGASRRWEKMIFRESKRWGARLVLGLLYLIPLVFKCFPSANISPQVSPEGVAAYESQVASIRRLQDLGVKELYSGGNTILNVAAAMIHLNGAVQASLERRLKMKKVLEIKTRQKSPRLIYFEKAFQKLDEEYREAKKRQEIAK
jgi:hypothetical protein